jgi:hypothetical protein
MRTATGDIVSRATVSPHKFGGDPMAEWLWLLALHGLGDESTGDALDWHCHVTRFGKRLLFCFPSGFVTIEKYDTEREASEAFNEIEYEMCGGYLGYDEAKEEL